MRKKTTQTQMALISGVAPDRLLTNIYYFNKKNYL